MAKFNESQIKEVCEALEGLREEITSGDLLEPDLKARIKSVIAAVVGEDASDLPEQIIQKRKQITDFAKKHYLTIAEAKRQHQSPMPQMTGEMREEFEARFNKGEASSKRELFPGDSKEEHSGENKKNTASIMLGEEQTKPDVANSSLDANMLSNSQITVICDELDDLKEEIKARKYTEQTLEAAINGVITGTAGDDITTLPKAILDKVQEVKEYATEHLSVPYAEITVEPMSAESINQSPSLTNSQKVMICLKIRELKGKIKTGKINQQQKLMDAIVQVIESNGRKGVLILPEEVLEAQNEVVEFAKRYFQSSTEVSSIYSSTSNMNMDDEILYESLDDGASTTSVNLANPNFEAIKQSIARQLAMPSRPENIEPTIQNEPLNIIVFGDQQDIFTFLNELNPSDVPILEDNQPVTINVPIVYGFESSHGNANFVNQAITFYKHPADNIVQSINLGGNGLKHDAVAFVGKFNHEQMIEDKKQHWFTTLEHLTVPFLERPLLKILVNIAQPGDRDEIISTLPRRHHFGFDFAIQSEQPLGEDHNSALSITQQLMTWLCSIIDRHTNPLLEKLNDQNFDISGVDLGGKNTQKVLDAIYAKQGQSFHEILLLLQATFVRVMQKKDDPMGKGNMFSGFIHKKSEGALSRTQYSWIDRLHDVFSEIVEKQLVEIRRLNHQCKLGKDYPDQQVEWLVNRNKIGANILFATLQYSLLLKQTNKRQQNKNIHTATMDKLIDMILKHPFEIYSYDQFNPLVFFLGNNGQLSDKLMKLVLHPLNWVGPELDGNVERLPNGFSEQFRIIGEAFAYRKARIAATDKDKASDQLRILCQALESSVKKAGKVRPVAHIREDLDKYCATIRADVRLLRENLESKLTDIERKQSKSKIGKSLVM